MNERFTELDDGWYRDSETGLEWSPTAPKVMNHADAIAWCESVGGRLPTIKELTCVVDYDKYNPCTDIPDTQSNLYWSASTWAPNPITAWRVSFNFGFVSANDMTSNLYVRAVRSGS